MTFDAIELLRHRGRDGSGHHVADGVGLAMRRLAIIDLESGDQPLSDEDVRLGDVDLEEAAPDQQRQSRPSNPERSGWFKPSRGL